MSGNIAKLPIAIDQRVASIIAGYLNPGISLLCRSRYYPWKPYKPVSRSASHLGFYQDVRNNFRLMAIHASASQSICG